MLDACGEASVDLVGIMTTRPSDQPDDISWSFAGRKSGNKSHQHLADLNFEFNYSINKVIHVVFNKIYKYYSWLTLVLRKSPKIWKTFFVSHVDFVKFISLITKQCHTQKADVIEGNFCIICYSSNNHVYGHEHILELAL